MLSMWSMVNFAFTVLTLSLKLCILRLHNLADTDPPLFLGWLLCRRADIEGSNATSYSSVIMDKERIKPSK